MTVFPLRCAFSRRRTIHAFFLAILGEGSAGPSGRPALLSAEKGDCKGLCEGEIEIFFLMFRGSREPDCTTWSGLSRPCGNDSLRHLCSGALACGRIEDLLPQAQRLWRGFNVFVGRNELEGPFEAHNDRRGQ
jgi:hypothetical protein